MDKKMNTVIDFEFYDGSTAKMTLAFYKLYQLRAKNENQYKKYNAAMNKGKNIDDLDTMTILYTAYVCANMEQPKLMTEEEFMIMCGSDRMETGRAVKALIQPKKQKASEDHSRNIPKAETKV